ncbi:hypothetical protein H2200_000886 [Cladophialophora chaetospira]|uniref:Glycoside hydrolase family 125 protein n=1 Tax=Cladophialophora chaetospira TaxID=386627 RepID=A0AA38XPA3_9EURO|nr:hypothetical protein H2200_000886 [Cladophialophora chaetospira]
MNPSTLTGLFLFLAATASAQVNYTCPNPAVYFTEYHGPFSAGRFNLSYQRPPAHCRTFNLSDVEDTVTRVKGQISDPDLSRLFENAFPNTLDTAIRWHGFAANNSEEELTFVITGDINAMWLRDSSNQLQSYLSLLKADTSSHSLASLYRGVINLQSRYINTSPHCNSYQPPAESGVEPAVNSFAATDVVTPNVTNTTVFECKYELDSLAAFLEVSYNYYNATEDLDFFNRYQWVDTVQTILNTVVNLTAGTYGPDGRVLDQPYTWNRTANSATESVSNLFRGNPVLGGTGLIRSYFRPSDDSCTYQLFIPANMMFSHFLGLCADIMQGLKSPSASGLASTMRSLESGIRAAIDAHALLHVSGNTTIYAYEVDGYGSFNIMDDANIPSLLSAPFFGYDVDDPTYQATRQLLLSSSNSYYMRGPVLNAIGGPHVSFGYAWPMASIVRILTSSDDDEIRGELRQLVSSTDGLGMIHESVNSWNVSDWTRPWFSWANGLFGQMILDLEDRKPYLLSESYQ